MHNKTPRDRVTKRSSTTRVKTYEEAARLESGDDPTGEVRVSLRVGGQNRMTPGTLSMAAVNKGEQSKVGPRGLDQDGLRTALSMRPVFQLKIMLPQH